MKKINIAEHNRWMLSKRRKSRNRSQISSIENSLIYSNPRLKQMFEEGVSEQTTIIFFDIFNFSSEVSNLKPIDIKGFLNPYYKKIFEIITKWNGVIEKVMGDGIIAVFTGLFNGLDIRQNHFNAIACLIQIIKQFQSSKYESKGTLHFSQPYYCKIGSEDFYKEYTVIGEGLTYCYRMEGIIENPNSIVCLESQSDFFGIRQLNKWDSYSDDYEFAGIGHEELHFWNYPSANRW